MRRLHGFTLIELMIVVAIIGILAAVAIPSYNNYVVVSYGGSLMKKATPVSINAQVCIQTQLGCTDLNTLDSGSTLINFSVPAAQNTPFIITFVNDRCSLNADLDAFGGVSFSIHSVSGLASEDTQCEQGAGL